MDKRRQPCTSRNCKTRCNKAESVGDLHASAANSKPTTTTGGFPLAFWISDMPDHCEIWHWQRDHGHCIQCALQNKGASFVPQPDCSFLALVSAKTELPRCTSNCSMRSACTSQDTHRSRESYTWSSVCLLGSLVVRHNTFQGPHHSFQSTQPLLYIFLTCGDRLWKTSVLKQRLADPHHADVASSAHLSIALLELSAVLLGSLVWPAPTIGEGETVIRRLMEPTPTFVCGLADIDWALLSRRIVGRGTIKTCKVAVQTYSGQGEEKGH